MNWLTNFVRPKIKALVGNKPDVPDNMWHKCPGCSQMIFHRDLTANDHVCPHCDHHLRMPILQRAWNCCLMTGPITGSNCRKVPWTR